MGRLLEIKHDLLDALVSIRLPGQQTVGTQQLLSVQIADGYGVWVRDFEQQGCVRHADPDLCLR